MEEQVLTFDPGESLLRGQIPLKEFGDILKLQDETKVVKIDFSRNGYCNDAVLRLILEHKKKDFSNLKEVLLDGCILITNAGIKWLSKIIQGADMLQKIVLDGNTNLGDNEMYLLTQNIGPMCEIYMRGTFIRYVSELEKSKVKVDGCPLVGTEVVADINYGHSFVFPDKSMENSLCHLITDQKKVKREPYHYITNFMNNGWSYSFSEMNLEHPLFDIMMSNNPVQVIIPFDEKADVKEVKQHITNTIVKVVSKASFTTDFRKGREKLEESSNMATHYGTAKIKLLKLAHKIDVPKDLVHIFGEDGSRKGQLECSIHLCKPNGEIIKEQEPLIQSKKLLGQEIYLKVKISFASGLSPDVESSFCKFKFFHIFNQYVKTVELPGQHPKYDFERMFHSKVVRQRLLSYLEKASLNVEVWTRTKSDNKAMETEVKVGGYPNGINFADDGSEYRACEFIVLENGTKGDNLQNVKLTPEMFQPTLREISINVEKQEKNFKDLDLHGQQMYSSLCKTREAIQEFCDKQIEKIHYMSADLTSKEGSDKLLKQMSTIMNYHKCHMEGKYSMSHGRIRMVKTLTEIIQEDKIVDFDGKIGTEEIYMIERRVDPAERTMKTSGHEILLFGRQLHEQGKIAIVTLGPKTLLVDINLLQTLIGRLTDVTTMQQCGKLSTCIGEMSRVWTSESIEKHLWKDVNIPTDQLGQILQEYLGLIEVPAWRFSPDDTQFLYSVSNVICPVPVSLTDFWKKNDSNKDFVVMRKTYSFLFPVSNTLLSGIQSSATYYGRTLLLTTKGAVFQIGCVQTAIIKETGHLGYDEICVESKCYLPDRRAGPVNNVTESYVQEYTWNVFCLYTDVVEKILKQCNIVCTVLSENPTGLVNISIGCKHSWQSYLGRTSQSVCTMCNKCCDKGRKCPYNGIMGKYLRECGCKTCVNGCDSCGICVDCVEKHWNIRSYLRPLAMTYNIDKEKVKMAEREVRKNEEDMLEEIKEELLEDNKPEMTEKVKEEENEESNPFEQLYKSQGAEENEKEKSSTYYYQVPLDPVAFNEFEVQHIHTGYLGIVLRECSKEQGERIVVFPGKAMTIQADDDIDESSMAEKISSITSGIMSYTYKFDQGDTIRVRISDPYRKLVKKSGEHSLSDRPKVSRVVYHPAVCSETIISHETGILCYHSGTANTPKKAYFIGSKPFSEKLNSFSISEYFTPKKAYFIGSKPFPEKLNTFSIKILNNGALKYIGVGVSANKNYDVTKTNQPDKEISRWGKDVVKSDKDSFQRVVKYYINKGGVYNQRGCFEQKQGSDQGDVITVVCDVVNKKVKFLRNDETITEVEVEDIPYGGYYPQISLNSEGESVQLLDKSIWGPDPNKIKVSPTAFNMHKYSNLWISPATTIMMTSRKVLKGDTSTGEQSVNGWLILHNPTNQQIGYSIQPDYFVQEPKGCLQPGESKPFHIKSKVKGKGVIALETGVRIMWIALEQQDTYTVETIASMFEKSSNINMHRLNCVGKSTNQSDSEALPLFNDAFVTEGDNYYKLQVYKNSRFINSYCLKKGKYVVDLYSLFKGKEPEYILKRPKCPSFLYPSSLQKGMQCIIKLQRFVAKDEFADGLIAEKQERGYRIECTADRDDDFSQNNVSFLKEGLMGVSDSDWSKMDHIKDITDITLFPLETCVSNRRAALSKTYVPAPPYLITKGSAELRDILNPEWQIHALMSFSSCSQSIARPTVQELSIASHSRGLLKWIKHREKTIPQTSVFLPTKLDNITMMYPQITTMFSDVSLYRLCFFHEKFWADKNRQTVQAQTKTDKLLTVKSLYNNQKKHYVVIHVAKRDKVYMLKNPQEVNLHLMDIPPYTMKKPALVDISYGCLYQAWTYVALLAYPLLVPSYGQMLSGGTGDLGRQQIENLLYQLIQPFASLCGIYSAQHGGLSNQLNPSKYSTRRNDLCSDPKIPMADENLTEDNLIDNHLFFELSSLLACKAHYHGFRAQNLIPTSFDFSLEKTYFQPLSENLNTLIINGHELKTLPSDIFETFKNLYILSLIDVTITGTAVLPPGISQCKNLEIVCLSSVQGLTEVSRDLLLGPALTTIYLHNTPIRKLDIDWPITSMLTSLSLAGILIEEVPKGVGKLEKLQELVLDYNPITTLPDELENLQKLKVLSIKGIPWIIETTPHSFHTSTLHKGMIEAWNEKHPYALNYMSDQTIDKLFHKYDVNSNNVLDPTELANLNMYLMMNIPRLGLKKLDDKEFGMVPPVVFKLKSLTKLDLSYSAITHIPDKVKNLLKLQYFNLEHSPILDTISGQLGLLPSLGSIYLNGCPLLETPPLEIVGRGFDAIKAFLKRIAAGFTECHRTKLMFIGLGQAGKTTLLQALRSEKKMTMGSIEAKLTDGIEIKPWIVPINYEGKQINITYSCWDFAGQTVYYNTHQFFLSKQAVYMLLWNMRMGFEHSGLDFWMSSVACHCPEAPVIVVGTQLDQIPMPDIPEAEIMEKYPQIKKFCYVSSTEGTNIPELEEALIDITMNHCTQMQMKIPKVWLSFENGILKERDGGMNIMDWWAIKQCAIKNGIYDVKDIRLAVQFLNDLGTVQYFDTDFLRNKVVINPQWIVDVMAKVVSVNEKSIKENKGRFYHKFVSEIWKDYEPSLHEWMLKLTERFDLTFPLPDETEDKFNIVPCLLPETRPKNLKWPYLSEDEGFRESTILYKFTYLPTGLFNRAQARLFNQGFTDEKLIDFMWKKGSILRKNQHYALVKQVNDFEMIVSVQGPRPKNVMDLIHETISTLIKDAFVGVDYDYYIQCPDCVEKEGTKDPFLFKADLISRAHSVNAPFLQCTKFFHTVSIAELLRIMPESKETEFDTQIQESISTLEEINSNMATDVAILYSPADLKSTQTDSVNPKNIYKDLKNAGYNCWFPADMNNTAELEMTLAVKNSKVLVVCMSDNFVRYKKCHKMFLYATEQLHKPFAVAAITESLSWQQTDIGFKIGNPRMAMIKNVKRYTEKIKDLIDIVKTHIDDLEKMKLSTPSVFISYCWKNSKEACSITTQATAGSLGYGDPRALKTYLEKNGNRCWLDIEQMGRFGLYQDITVGLQNSKVLVICVSDEYLESDACMMEARFGVYNMLLPIVVCVVGTGKSWKDSEISLMVHRQGDLAKVVKMQKTTPDAYETVLMYVKNYLQRPETEKQRKVRERLDKVKLKQEKQKKDDLDKKLKQQGDTNFSYQEEIELIQRKFMRYVSKLSVMEETRIPRLLVVDFTEQKQSRDTDLLKELQNTNQEKAIELSEAISDASKDDIVKAQNMLTNLQVTTGLSSIDEEDETMSSNEMFSQSQTIMNILTECTDNKWEGQDLCLRVLCEYEQGWHFYGISFGLDKLISGPDNVNKLIKEAAPYLARFCTILKQSGVDLNCEGSLTGELFLSYIRKEGTSTKNFTEAYRILCKSVEEFLDKDNWWLDNFPKYALPNGKIAYLCEEHVQKVGATIIHHGAETSGHVRDLLSEQDKYLKEVLSELLRIKRMKLNKGKVKPGSASKVQIEKKDELTKKTPKKQTPVEPAKTEKQEQPTEASNMEKPGSRPESSSSSVVSSKGVKRQKSQRQTSQACSIQ